MALSSGTTAISTDSANPKTLIAAQSAQQSKYITIVNESAVQGFYSFDGGASWHYLPAAASGVPSSVTVYANVFPSGLTVKRAASIDVTGLYASAF